MAACEALCAAAHIPCSAAEHVGKASRELGVGCREAACLRNSAARQAPPWPDRRERSGSLLRQAGEPAAGCRPPPPPPTPYPPLPPFTPQGASRCLRSALGLPTSSTHDDGGSHDQQQEQHTSFLAYGHHALAAFLHTAATAFHERSYWTATALLDVPALWAVWRSHRTQHAEAAAAAAVRRAAADPANTATHTVEEPSRELDLALLRCAAAHATAAYGAPAACGSVSSALGYLALVTVHQAT